MNHPGIVQVIELGESVEGYYLVMEYLEGFDLNALLTACAKKKKRIAPGVVCYLISEVATALSYAHDLRDSDAAPLGIVHRDVTPSNIMVTSTGAVKLLDFGIAKATESIQDERTRTGATKGKLGYMSPEQSDGRTLDRRSDIFSLGVVMYEALTAKRLFHGATDFAMLRLVRAAEVEPPSTECPELDREIDAIVLKMLARDREHRFRSCDEVVKTLAPIVHRLCGDSLSLRRFVEDLAPERSERVPISEKELNVNDHASEASETAPGFRRDTQPFGGSATRKRNSWWIVAALAVFSVATSIGFYRAREHRTNAIPAVASEGRVAPVVHQSLDASIPIEVKVMAVNRPPVESSRSPPKIIHPTRSRHHERREETPSEIENPFQR